MGIWGMVLLCFMNFNIGKDSSMVMGRIRGPSGLKVLVLGKGLSVLLRAR